MDLKTILNQLETRLKELGLNEYANGLACIDENKIFMAVATYVVPYFTDKSTYGRDLFCFIEMLRLTMGIELSDFQRALINKHHDEIVKYVLQLKFVVENE